MKQLIPLLIFLLILTGCSAKEADNRKLDQSLPGEEYPVGEDVKLEDNTINITIKNITYTADLSGNEASNELLQHLPLTLEMQELNGNEKFADLNFALPVEESDTNEIHSGDLMLYGDNTLVLFYKDFETTYKYTPIAHIQSPEGLDQHLGEENVTVEFN